MLGRDTLNTWVIPVGCIISLLDMIKPFFPGAIFQAFDSVRALNELLDGINEEQLTDRHREILRAQVEILGMAFVNLADGRFDYIITQLKELAEDHASRLSSFRETLDRFHTVFDHELRKTLCFVVRPGEEKLFYKDRVSETIRKKLPNCTFDLLEAHRSLLFQRNTACVYHCMCALDILLQYIVKKFKALGATYDPKKATEEMWHSIINRLEKELRDLENAPRSTPQRSKRLKKLGGLCAHMRSVKNAWRNDTMHAKGQFAEEVASDILSHTVSLIQFSAENL